MGGTAVTNGATCAGFNSVMQLDGATAVPKWRRTSMTRVSLSGPETVVRS